MSSKISSWRTNSNLFSGGSLESLEREQNADLEQLFLLMQNTIQGLESLLHDVNDALVAKGFDIRGISPADYVRPDDPNDVAHVITLELERIEQALKRVEGEHANLDWLLQWC
jgi:hypothetical protein